MYAAFTAPKPAATETPEYIAYELPENIVYDEVIEGDVVLDARLTLTNKKVLYKGDVTLKAGVTISVGSVLAVEGDLVLSGGTMTAQGMVYVGGDLRIQNIDADGKFGLTSAYMNIFPDAKVVVKGDFYSQSSVKHGYGGAGAILELHGNMHLLSDVYQNSISACFTTVFAGAKEQHVYASSTTAVFGRMMTAKTGGFVNFDDPVNSVILVGNATVKNGRFIYINTNGFTLTAEESLYIQYSNITGQVYTGKDLVFCGVSVTQFHAGSYTEVGGDLRIQNIDVEGEYSLTSAVLHMRTGSKMVVKGDFYNQSSSHHGYNSFHDGILELHGDMHLLSDVYQYRDDGFTTVFAGAKEQHVYASSTTAVFGRMMTAKTGGFVNFDDPVNSVILVGNATVKNGRFIYINTNGFTLTAEESLYIQYSNITGQVYTGKDLVFCGVSVTQFHAGSYTEVGGDLRIQNIDADGKFGLTSAYMNIFPDAKVVVKGDFYSQSSVKHGYGGAGAILELHGNMHLLSDVYQNSISACFTTVFAGAKEQHVYANTLSETATFGKISQRSKNSSIVLHGKINSMSAESDINFKGSGKIVNGNLNGHSARFR